MGNPLSLLYVKGSTPPEIPEPREKPTFHPQFGFKMPRVPRETISEQEMKALNMKRFQRDYCAHMWKYFKMCNRDYFPIVGLCFPEYHAYIHCQEEDMILRMKEYEREKRLRIRAAKRAQMGL